MIIRFRKLKVFGFTAAVLILLLGGLVLLEDQELLSTLSPIKQKRVLSQELKANNEQLLLQGQQIFRYDTFGDEKFWGGTLQLHKAIAGANLGGIGPGISPKAALALGLKVDSNSLPSTVQNMLKEGKLDLNDPAVTVSLLKLNAVVGLTGFFDQGGRLCSIGIQCALCHSTVDDSLAPGIGRRLDGWANRDLNVGAIIAAAPNLKALADRLGVSEAKAKEVLLSWGPGKYDAELNEDGKAFRPDGKPAATLLPSAFGLAGVNLHTWTGWGSVPYWNAYVANTQMRGLGTFYDPRLNNPDQFPLAVKTGDWNIRNTPDLITSKLPALHLYQLALNPPKPPEGSYDPAAARRGEGLFRGKALCAQCHVPPLYLEPGHSIHTGREIGIDNFQADRSPAHGYRTSPLRGLWTHQKGGFFHDGRFATLLDVVNHFNSIYNLKLTEQEKSDVVEFLKSL
ncbi:MAG TPA: hypothetical protein VHS59_03635 [Bacillota bacterium]|nr:hypothetical protein [Bacillota bacterium]